MLDFSEDCPICGADAPAPIDSDAWGAFCDAHEHPEAVVMTGDGWFGQYLPAAFILDVHANIVPVPGDVLEAAELWYDSMHPSSNPEPTDEQAELVLDWVGNPADSLLAEHGMFVEWEDGFVVYRYQTP